MTIKASIRCMLVHKNFLTILVTKSEGDEILMLVPGKHHNLFPELDISLPKSTIQTLDSNHASPL
ncbi:hypothetical protein Hanom_Chr10g00955251 [Helianthus anomalus]